MKPASESLIAEFERRIGTRLPSDYRSYLATKNGGSPERPMYEGPVVEGYVQFLFPLSDDQEKGLFWEWETATLPQTFKGLLLPIAVANGGDQILLSLVCGEIFLFDHETDTYSVIESSFGEFIARIS